MDLIKTGIGLTKTFKNVARTKEILSVLARNGFDEMIISTQLHRRIPGFVLPRSKKSKPALDKLDGDHWWSAVGKGLRESFTELGPSFIKLGQLMATREDIFHPNLVSELRTLQNRVSYNNIPDVKKVISKNIQEKNFEDIFSSIEEQPIGNASIAQVYRAVLVSGEDVVVKVRKPGIGRLIRTDFAIIRFLVLQAEKVSLDFKKLGVSKVIDDFFKGILIELNFSIEALNCEKLAKNLTRIQGSDLFVLPKVYKDFSGSKILVMQYLEGTPFNEIACAKSLPEGFEKKLEKAVKLFIHSLLADGFFHADLHGGNFFLLNDGKIGLIDFGLMGTLSRKNRGNLVAILYSLFKGDFENLVYEFLDVAEYEVIPNIDNLIADVKDTLTPYIGLSVQETNISELVTGLIKTLGRHQLYLPREWFIIFRALMTVDGTGKALGLDLNIYKMLDEDLKGIMGEIFSYESVLEDSLWTSRDLLSSLRVLPRHLRWFLKEASRKNYAIDINLKGHEKDVDRLIDGVYFLGASVLCSVFVACGVYFIDVKSTLDINNIPVISILFWSIGAILFLRASWRL